MAAAVIIWVPDTVKELLCWLDDWPLLIRLYVRVSPASWPVADKVPINDPTDEPSSMVSVEDPDEAPVIVPF